MHCASNGDRETSLWPALGAGLLVAPAYGTVTLSMSKQTLAQAIIRDSSHLRFKGQPLVALRNSS